MKREYGMTETNQLWLISGSARDSELMTETAFLPRSFFFSRRDAHRP